MITRSKIASKADMQSEQLRKNSSPIILLEGSRFIKVKKVRDVLRRLQVLHHHSSATLVTLKLDSFFQCFIAVFNTFDAGRLARGISSYQILSDQLRQHQPYSNQVPTACKVDALPTRPSQQLLF